jgi:hypothetical protein
MKGQGIYTIHGTERQPRLTIPRTLEGSAFPIEVGTKVHITLVEDCEEPHLRIYPEE